VTPAVQVRRANAADPQQARNSRGRRAWPLDDAEDAGGAGPQAWLSAPGGPGVETPLLSRIHNDLLGGFYTFRIDHKAAQELTAAVPWAAPVVWSARAFMHRAVRYLAAQGVDQYADIGCGIPQLGATHEILRTVSPNARLVYLDRDPVAVLLGQELVADIPSMCMAQADLRDPDTVIDRLHQGGIDLSRPVGLLLGGVLACLPDRQAHPALAALHAAIAPGSWLALTHITPQVCAGLTPEAADYAAQVLHRTPTPIQPRRRADMARFLSGRWRVVEPGLVDAAKWRPDPHEPTGWVDRYPTGAVLAGVARMTTTPAHAQPDLPPAITPCGSPVTGGEQSTPPSARH
jgi:S-adenosyl methyltransferase